MNVAMEVNSMCVPVYVLVCVHACVYVCVYIHVHACVCWEAVAESMY